MKSYETVTEALADLKRRGFTHDFNLRVGQFQWQALAATYAPSQLHIMETYRFEGDSDPADEAIVYAISADDGVHGSFVSAYGPYANSEYFFNQLSE